MDDLASTILSLMIVQQFTESRWLTVGQSCRTLVLCRLLGIHSLVNYILSMPAGNQGHLIGYKKLEAGETQEFCITCALSGFVADGVLAEILQDNRAGKQVPHWRDVANEEMAWVRSLGTEVMQAFVARGVAGKLSAQQLHDRVMHSALIARAFIEQEAFQPASVLPWTLGH
eukprot:1761265-Lingulodinium_polyedra.AAC.1